MRCFRRLLNQEAARAQGARRRRDPVSRAGLSTLPGRGQGLGTSGLHRASAGSSAPRVHICYGYGIQGRPSTGKEPSDGEWRQLKRFFPNRAARQDRSDCTRVRELAGADRAAGWLTGKDVLVGAMTSRPIGRKRRRKYRPRQSRDDVVPRRSFSFFRHELRAGRRSIGDVVRQAYALSGHAPPSSARKNSVAR